MVNVKERIRKNLNGWVESKRSTYQLILGSFWYVYCDKRVKDAGKLIVDLCIGKKLLVSNEVYNIQAPLG